MKVSQPKKISTGNVETSQLFQITRNMQSVWFDIRYNLLLVGKKTANLPNLKMDAFYYESKTPNLFLVDPDDNNIIYIGEL